MSGESVPPHKKEHTAKKLDPRSTSSCQDFGNFSQWIVVSFPISSV